MTKQRYLYKNYVETLSRRFLAKVSDIQWVYGFDAGPEFEIAICQVLRDVLPQKFGICRGHVVSAEGQQAGDDIIVYDRLLFPTLRLLEDNYAQKEWVPIEAIYAYIEAKHTMILDGAEDDNQSLAHTCKQLGQVKALCARRQPVPMGSIARTLQSPKSDLQSVPNVATIRNPLYGIILSRFVRIVGEKEPLTDPDKIYTAICHREIPDEHPPDMIVAGKSNLVTPTEKGPPGGIRPFKLFSESGGMYGQLVAKDIAFGTGLCMLLSALDYIQLGTMPWNAILNDVIGEQPQPQFMTNWKPSGA